MDCARQGGPVFTRWMDRQAADREQARRRWRRWRRIDRLAAISQRRVAAMIFPLGRPCEAPNRPQDPCNGKGNRRCDGLARRAIAGRSRRRRCTAPPAPSDRDRPAAPSAPAAARFEIRAHTSQGPEAPAARRSVGMGVRAASPDKSAESAPASSAQLPQARSPEIRVAGRRAIALHNPATTRLPRESCCGSLPRDAANIPN